MTVSVGLHSMATRGQAVPAASDVAEGTSSKEPAFPFSPPLMLLATPVVTLPLGIVGVVDAQSKIRGGARDVIRLERELADSLPKATGAAAAEAVTRDVFEGKELGRLMGRLGDYFDLGAVKGDHVLPGAFTSQKQALDALGVTPGVVVRNGEWYTAVAADGMKQANDVGRHWLIGKNDGIVQASTGSKVLDLWESREAAAGKAIGPVREALEGAKRGRALGYGAVGGSVVAAGIGVALLAGGMPF